MLAIVCPIAGVALVVVIVKAVVIGCLVMKLVKRKINRQTAAEDRCRADEWYKRAQNPNLTAGQRDECFNMVNKNEDHALRVTADSDEAVLEEEEDTEGQNQPNGVHTPEDATQ